MEFYHNIITEQSFKFLQFLRKKFKFVLIGGWAVFLYAHTLKSKDIDLIIDYDELSKLKEDYDVSKNARLKKYEIKQEKLDIDIYLPHYSDIGIDVAAIQDSAQSREGFLLPQLEMLFLLKLYAYKSRKGSLKGRKDELDIFSLAFLSEFDWKKYMQLIKEFKLEEFHQEFVSLLKRTRSIEELQVNEQKMAKKRNGILKKLEL